MRRRRGIGRITFLPAVLPLLLSLPAFGVSCTTQSQMTAQQRAALRQAALSITRDAQKGDIAALQAQTIPAVAKNFAGIAASAQAAQPAMSGAILTVDNLYLLDATDLKQPADADFFCGLANSDLTVEITIPDLPPGNYALAITHATGVRQPRQFGLILQNQVLQNQVLQNQAARSAAPQWELAGFFSRPMTMGGHGGVWFWKQARAWAAKQDDWSAWFYYQTAKYLLVPVDFLTSPNLQKLQSEAGKVRPASLPGAEPMQLTAGGQTFEITDLHAGEFSGDLDLVLTCRTASTQDPVAARAEVLRVMNAVLAQHPGVRQAFHCLWVHAATPGNSSSFALELPMDQIEKAVTHPRTTK